MLNQRSTATVYPALKEKLRHTLLATPDILKALAGLSPDTATMYLCKCVVEEAKHRRGREKTVLVLLVLGVGLWTALNAHWGTIGMLGWSLFLAGPLLISLAIWLSQRRFTPLRDNALLGLTQVVLEIHECETLEPLCEATALLNGAKRPWEAEIEAALRGAISRLLIRLSADEAALLPDHIREFLLSAIKDRRHTELTIAALLTLGSAKDEAAVPLAEALRTSLAENIREAALDYLRELRGTT